MKWCTTKDNFDSRKLTTLLNYNRQLDETTVHLKKGYKIYLQFECHFSYYYSQDFIINCYIHRRDKLHVRAI